MIGSEDIFVDPSFLDVLFQFVGYKEIIDSPTDIARTAIGFHVPPGVVPAFFFKHAEGIDVAGLDELIDPIALHAHKAARIGIFLWSGKIDFLMGRVDIARDDDGLLFPEGFCERKETLVEFQFEFQTLRSHAAIWEIDIKEIELVELEQDDAPLAIQKRIAKRRFRKYRRDIGVDGRTAIPFFDRTIPIRFVTIGMDELFGELSDFRLGFLNTDDIVFGLMEPIQKSFAFCGADTIYIPGDERDAFGHGGSVK